MSPQIATLAFVAGILGLFALERDRQARTSRALWLPVVWLWMFMSRPVSVWLAVIGLVDVAPLRDSPDRYLEGSPLDRNVIAGLLVLGVIVLVNRRRQVATLLRANTPILLLLLYTAMSVLWSDYPDVALKRWIKGQGGLIMVLIVLTDPDRPAALRRIVARTAFLVVPLSLLMINYYPDVGRVYDRWTWTPVYVGVTSNKNELGMVCLICGLGSVWRFLTEWWGREVRRHRFLIAHAALLAMVLRLFGMANSMTSLACFLMGSGLMAVASPRLLFRKPRVVHLLLAAGVFVCAVALFSDAGAPVLGAMDRNPTLTGRTEIWRQVIRLSGNPLFGTGFESFWLGERLRKMWDLYWFHPIQAHNGYLEIYLNLGWIGVALLAAVIVTGYPHVADALRRDPNAGRLRLAYFLVFVIYNVTEAAFGGLMWFAFLVAIIAVPKPPIPHGSPQLVIEHGDNLADARFLKALG
jgi:exopolysaccharide production protein ExoQ